MTEPSTWAALVPELLVSDIDEIVVVWALIRIVQFVGHLWSLANARGSEPQRRRRAETVTPRASVR